MYSNPVSSQGWMNLNLSGNTSSGGGGSSNGGNGGNSNSGEMPLFPCDNPTPNGCEEEEDDKIFNELTGKADCAYNKLLSSGVANFHNMITDLFIEFGDNNIGGRDLTFEMSSNLPNSKGGKTIPLDNGNFTILINQNLMNTLSSIEIAAILVHEISHAFLAKHYNDANSSFKELYKKYLDNTGYSGPIHHNIMEDNFIDRMATVLQNYDSSVFSNFNDYKILASQGVFNLTTSELQALNSAKTNARNNDSNCD
jgi:hypothetical protein